MLRKNHNIHLYVRFETITLFRLLAPHPVGIDMFVIGFFFFIFVPVCTDWLLVAEQPMPRSNYTIYLEDPAHMYVCVFFFCKLISQQPPSSLLHYFTTLIIIHFFLYKNFRFICLVLFSFFFFNCKTKISFRLIEFYLFCTLH